MNLAKALKVPKALKALLVHCLPDPPEVDGFFKTTKGLHWLYLTFKFQVVYNNYHDWYYALRKDAVAWHQKWIERLHPPARVHFTLHRLREAREKADAAGIRSYDPRYPSLSNAFKKDTR